MRGKPRSGSEHHRVGLGAPPGWGLELPRSDSEHPWVRLGAPPVQARSSPRSGSDQGSGSEHPWVRLRTSLGQSQSTPGLGSEHPKVGAWSIPGSGSEHSQFGASSTPRSCSGHPILRGFADQVCLEPPPSPTAVCVSSPGASSETSAPLSLGGHPRPHEGLDGAGWQKSPLAAAARPARR